MDIPQDLVLAERRIIRLLGERRTRTFGLSRRRRAVRHPEVRKSLEESVDRLRQFAAPGLRENLPDARLSRLLDTCEWLRDDATEPTIEQAWYLADALLELWIELVPNGTLIPYLTKHPLPAGAVRDDASASGSSARDWALFDFRERRFRGTHERARTALRTHYLQRVGVVLWLTVLVAATVAAFASGDTYGTALTALAGALGGTLSGARALRDAVALRRSRAFQAWWWVQPAVGAAVGLLMYAILSSPILTLPGTGASGWTRLSSVFVYAFAAGFSEPFVLGVLAKITGAVDAATQATQQSTNNSTAGSNSPPNPE